MLSILAVSLTSALAAPPKPTTQSPATTFKAAEVDISYSTACARTTEGRVVCWGQHFQIHDGHGAWTIDEARDVVAHTLENTTLTTLHRDGSVRVWTIGEFPSVWQPIANNAVAIGRGAGAPCAVLADGTVQCWGGAFVDIDTPHTTASVPGLKGIQRLACDEWGCVAINSKELQYAGRGSHELFPRTDRFQSVSLPGPTEGELVLGYERACWTGGRCAGAPYEGLTLPTLEAATGLSLGYDLGCATTASATTCRSYRHTIDLPPMRQVDVDSESGCAVDGTGGVWCWGTNEHGLLGDGSPLVDPKPARFQLSAVEQLVAFYGGTCAVSQGDWYCVGNELSKPTRAGPAFAVLGKPQYTLLDAQGTTVRRLSVHWSDGATIDSGIGPAADAIAATEDRVGNLYVASRTAVYVAWSLGEAGHSDTWAPLGQPPSFGAITSLAATASGVCVLADNGHVGCWDDSRFVGDPDFVDAPRRKQALSRVEGLEDVVEIAAAQSGLCARTQDGRVLCRNDTILVAAEKPGIYEIDALKGATDIDTRHRHLCAVVAGQVKCIGDNGAAQLGRVPQNGRYGSRSLEPVTVPLPAAAIEVAVGQDHSCARLEDKTVWCWGSDEDGQLGRNRPVLLLDRAVQVRGSGAPSPAVVP